MGDVYDPFGKSLLRQQVCQNGMFQKQNNEHEYSLNYSVSIQFINVSLSTLNFFFSLSTKEIQERVNKLEIMNTLLQDPSKVSVCLRVTLINLKWYCFREWVMEFKVGVWDGNLSRQNHSTWQIN